MKNLLLTVALLAGTWGLYAQTSFDYEQATEKIYGFGDDIDPITVKIIDNPVAGGINTSRKVVSYHTTDGRWCGLKQRIDAMDVIQTKKKYQYFSIKFYQPVATTAEVQKIRLKLLGSWMDLSESAIKTGIENGIFSEGASMDDETLWTLLTGEQGQEFAFEGSETDGTSPVNKIAGEWIELKYDISLLNESMFPDGKIYGFAIEPTNGAGKVGDYTCYVDDVKFIEDPNPDVEVPADSYTYYTLDDFEGEAKAWVGMENASWEIVDNPLSGDLINNSAKVAKVTRTAGSNNWAGIILDGLTLNMGTKAVDTYRYAHVKVYKTTAGEMNFKVEGGPAGASLESPDVPYTPDGKWQNIVFDLTGAKAGEYSKAFIMVDRTDNIPEDYIVYIDDIKLSNTDVIEGSTSNIENVKMGDVYIAGNSLYINLDAAANVSVKIYAPTGQMLSDVFEGKVQSGMKSLSLDVAKGLYIVLVKINGQAKTFKVIR